MCVMQSRVDQISVVILFISLFKGVLLLSQNIHLNAMLIKNSEFNYISYDISFFMKEIQQ